MATVSDILITGANGQLGNEFRVLAKAEPDFHFLFTDVDELNIADRSAVISFIDQFKPSVILNCAAYTAVDKAESEPEKARLLNETAVSHLVAGAKSCGATMIQISTDYVFDGTQSHPYQENDLVCPVSVYGATKAGGEKVALTYDRTLIIRTAWLYSSFGHNFLKSMLRLGAEKSFVNVVDDQVGTPTYAADLAETILNLIRRFQSGGLSRGIYHYTNEGVCSWYDFATEIMQMAGFSCKVNPIPGMLYPTPVKRPSYSVLDKNKLRKALDLEIPHWKDGLMRCMQKLRG